MGVTVSILGIIKIVLCFVKKGAVQLGGCLVLPALRRAWDRGTAISIIRTCIGYRLFTRETLYTRLAAAGAGRHKNVKYGPAFQIWSTLTIPSGPKLCTTWNKIKTRRTLWHWFICPKNILEENKYHILFFPHIIRIPANLKPLFLNPIVPKCQYT